MRSHIRRSERPWPLAEPRPQAAGDEAREQPEQGDEDRRVIDGAALEDRGELRSGDSGGRLFGHGARTKLGETLLEAEDVFHAPARLEELNHRLQRLRKEARVLAAL
jgi:hypothetical protein